MAIGLQISGSGWTTEQLDRLSEVVAVRRDPRRLALSCHLADR